MSKKTSINPSQWTYEVVSKARVHSLQSKEKKEHFNVSLKLMSKENFPMDLRDRFQGQSIPYKIKKKKKLFNVSSKSMSKETSIMDLRGRFQGQSPFPTK